jgi:hypothetical protein
MGQIDIIDHSGSWTIARDRRTLDEETALESGPNNLLNIWSDILESGGAGHARCQVLAGVSVVLGHVCLYGAAGAHCTCAGNGNGLGVRPGVLLTIAHWPSRQWTPAR